MKTLEELKVEVENAKEQLRIAEQALEKCIANRKEELWKEIITAITNYETEIGPIVVIVPDYDEGINNDFTLDSIRDLQISGEMNFV